MNQAVSRREFLGILAAACGVPLLAQQNGPAFPPEALSRQSLWDDASFLGPWDPPEANVRLACRSWPGPCSLFGSLAHGVTAFFENGKLRSISILFIDAGAWFGYVPDVQAEAIAATRGPEFLRLFLQAATNARQGIGALNSKSQEIILGGKTRLKHAAQVTQHGDVWSRLVIWPEHSVKLTLFRDENDAKQLLSPARRTLKREEQARAFAELVQTEANGDRRIDHIPVLLQGNRAYCGVSILAMVLQHMGVRLETEELAAAAGIRFGITRDAKTREVYDDAATAGGIRIERSQRFETVRARASIEAGFPAVVFRHWSQERDFLHTTFAKRLASDPAAMLPRADLNDRKLGRGAAAARMPRS